MNFCNAQRHAFESADLCQWKGQHASESKGARAQNVYIGALLAACDKMLWNMQGCAFGTAMSCLSERTLVLSNGPVTLPATIIEVDNGPGKAIFLYSTNGGGEGRIYAEWYAFALATLEVQRHVSEKLWFLWTDRTAQMYFGKCKM